MITQELLDDLRHQAIEEVSNATGIDVFAVTRDEDNLFSQIRRYLPEQLRFLDTLIMQLDLIAQAINKGEFVIAEKFVNDLKNSFDYKESDVSIDYKKSLKKFFHLHEFDEHPHKKKAIAQYMDKFLEKATEHIEKFDFDYALDLFETKGTDIKYYHSEYVIDELRSVTQEASK